MQRIINRSKPKYLHIGERNLLFKNTEEVNLSFKINQNLVQEKYLKELKVKQYQKEKKKIQKLIE